MHNDSIKYFSGYIYRGLEVGFRKGIVGVKAGYIVEDREGEQDKDLHGSKIARNIIMAPWFFNAHTHLGDSFITSPPSGGLEKMVIPPHGVKHQRLKEASIERIGEGIFNELKFMARTGTGFFCDYREGGIDGLLAMDHAMNRAKDENIPIPAGIVLGRPEGAPHGKELDELLNISQGLGLCSLADHEPEEILALSENLRGKGKLLSAHFSEGKRERTEMVLRSGSWPLIHLSCATEKDISAIADAGLPVVVCPRSNLMFSLMPNVCKMIRAGVELMVGTDNAFITRPDMYCELDTLYRVFMHMNPGDVEGIKSIFRASLGIPLLKFGKDNMEGSEQERFRVGHDIAVNGFSKGKKAAFQVLENSAGAGEGEIEYYMINRASAMDIVDLKMP